MNKNNNEAKEIFHLTTQDFENSKTRCGFDVTIKTILFGLHKPFYPTKIHGYVSDQGRTISATWNHLGECTFRGSRKTSYDLLTPTKVTEIEKG